MTLRFLDTFVWAARLGSFSKTAEKLNTTQAAISHRIATFERDLGARVFERDPRRIRLTPDGRRALAHAEEIVRLTDALRDSIGDDTALRGTVRIGAVDTIVYAWLPHLIGQVHERYPSITLDVNVDTSFRLSQQICDGAIDVAILMGPVAHPEVACGELCTFDSCWVASTALDLERETPDLADLTAYPLLTFSRDSQPHRALVRLLAEAGLESARIYNSNSLAVMARLVSAGVGVGALPIVLVADLVAAGRIRILPLSAKVPSLNFHVVHRTRSADALVRVIVEMVADLARRYDAAGRLIDRQES